MHIPTIFLVNVSLAFIVSLTLVWTASRRYPALLYWGASFALNGVGYGLGALRGQIHDFSSIVIGNTILSISVTLLAEGIYRFQERRPPRLLLWAPVPVTAVVFAIFIGNMQARLIASSALLCLQVLLVLWPMFSECRRTAGRGQFVIMLGLGSAFLIMLVRLVYVLRGNVPSSLFDTDPLYSLIFFGNGVAMLLIAIGMVLMVHESTLDQLQTNEQQYRRLIESAQEGICVLDKTRCVYANAKTAELLGTSVEALQGSNNFLEFVHPDEHQTTLAHHTARLSGTADGQARDLRLLTQHHGARWFRISGMRILWQGQPCTLIFLSDVHERRQMEEHVRELAYLDELTRLPNRRRFLAYLQQLPVTGGHTEGQLGLMFIDLDRFKLLNDTHGHAVGDRLLIEVSDRLRELAGNDSVVARLGGDEFVMLLANLPHTAQQAEEKAQELAERVLARIQQPCRLATDNSDTSPTVTYSPSASIGIHLFTPGKQPVEDLLSQADKAMYQAKLAGRSQAVLSG